MNRWSKQRAAVWALRASAALTVAPAVAQPVIHTAEIIARSLSLDCLDYNPLKGLCIWLDCGLFGCELVAVPKVRHYSPDVVVSAYHETGENPWIDMRPIVGAARFDLEGGITAEAVERQHTNLRFKNVDAIGNPIAGLLDTAFSASGLMCESAARPFFPYFVSTLDTVAWRFGIPESALPESLIPRTREISGALGPLGSWGSVFPRQGFLVQAHDYKAGAVMAQRAADVVTQRDQPHVYVPVVADARDGYWPPGEAVENDPETAEWQMLLPEPESTCHVFAELDDLRSGIDDPYAARLSEHGDYVWNLWRPYECCEAAGGVLLFSIDF